MDVIWNIIQQQDHCVDQHPKEGSEEGAYSKIKVLLQNYRSYTTRSDLITHFLCCSLPLVESDHFIPPCYLALRHAFPSCVKCSVQNISSLTHDFF